MLSIPSMRGQWSEAEWGIATPHSAGISDGNAARVVDIFLDNLRRWSLGESLKNRVE